MAKATVETDIETRYETRLIEIRAERKVFNLTLSEIEVDFLMAIFYRVGGPPDTSPRGVADGIMEALSDAGAEFPNNWDDDGKPNGAYQILALMNETHIKFSEYGNEEY